MYEGSNLETISALALNPDSTKLAAHAIEYDSGDWDYRGYIFVVSTSDGSFHSKMARVQHGRRGYAENTARSAGMVFDAYDRVYFAFDNVADYKLNSDNGAISGYSTKQLIAAFNVQTDTFDYYHE